MKDVLLSKELGYLQIDNTSGAVDIGPTTSGIGHWNLSPGRVFWMEEIIDIAGLTKQELTFYPLSGDVQRGPVSVGLTGGFLTEWIIVTAAPVNCDTLIATDLTYGLPGAGSTTPVTEFQNIIWGQGWTWALNVSLPQNFGSPINITSLGSGEPTNGHRLYVYRLATLLANTPAPGTFAELPDVRLVLSGQVREEAEFQQLMRMRRTYELQQTYDED